MSMSLSHNDLETSIESTTNTAKCRICWRTSHITDLLSPCNCTGSQKYVHFQCIARWIQERDSDNRETCDVCRHNYENITISQKEKTFFQWLTEGEDVIGGILAAIIVIVFFIYILNMGWIQFAISFGRISDALRYIQLVLTIFFGLIFTIGLVVALFVFREQFREWQTSHFTTIVERLSNSRRSTVSSVTSSDHSITDSSSNLSQQENDGRELLINTKANHNQSYGSLC